MGKPPLSVDFLGTRPYDITCDVVMLGTFWSQCIIKLPFLLPSAQVNPKNAASGDGQGGEPASGGGTPISRCGLPTIINLAVQWSSRH